MDTFYIKLKVIANLTKCNNLHSEDIEIIIIIIIIIIITPSRNWDLEGSTRKVEKIA